jgi:magnesium chelatase family protein
MSKSACRCPWGAPEKYRARISGPLLDRLDIRIQLEPIPFADWTGANGMRPESSVAVRERVLRARAFADARQGRNGQGNARLSSAEIRKHCELDPSGLRLLETAVERDQISARGIARTLKVARTIADLAGSSRIEKAHLAEALHYRGTALV